MIAKFAAGVLALGMCANPALAATITEDIGFDGAACDLATCDGAYQPMPSFDTALGTLLSVRVSFTGWLNFYAPYWSFQPPDATSALQVQGSMDILDAETGNPVAVLNATSVWVYVTGPTFGIDAVLPIAGSFLDDPTFYINPPAPHELLVIPSGGIYACSGYCDGYVVDDEDGDIEGDMRVSFTYLPATETVPEPASAALLGIGLLGALVGRRKRLS